MRDAQFPPTGVGKRKNVVTQSYVWRILLVDDDEDDYLLTRSMLAESRQGQFQLEWASSYERGAEMLCDSSYDAVLMDYDMGARSGIDLIREAVACGCTTPIILLTGRGTYEIDIEAMQAGAVDYLNKAEINPAFLERSIRYAIERRRGEQALAEANRALAESNAQAQASRQELFELIESISDSFIALDRDWRIIYANWRAAGARGREPAGLIGKVIWQEFPEMTGTLFEQRCREVMETRRPQNFEWQSLNDQAWYEVNIYPYARGISVHSMDITGQKQAERLLAESQERLQKLFERIPVMIVMHHRDARFTQINAAFTALTGWTSQDARGGDLLALCYPDPTYREEVRAFMAAPDGGWRDFFITTRSGEVIETSWTYLRLSDDSHIAIGIDLREQKQAEQTLLELNALLQQRKLELEVKNQQLEGLFRNAPAAMALYDAQPPYRLLSGNAFLQQSLAEPFRSLGAVGAPLEQIVPHAAEEGVLAVFEEVARTGQTRTLYRHMVTGLTEGRTWWNWTLSPVVVEGQVAALACMAVNITEEVRARQEQETGRAFLQAVLDQLPVAVVIVDAQTRALTLGNQQVEKTWRHPLDRPPRPNEPWEFRAFYPDGRAYAPEELPIARALRGEPVRGEELIILRGDGTYGAVQVDASPVRSPEGEIQAGVGVFLDITERKRAERDTLFLIDLGDLLNQPIEPETLLGKISSLTGSHLDCARCMFHEFDPDRGVAIVHSDYHPGMHSVAGSFPLEDQGGEVFAGLKAGRPVLVRDLQLDPRTFSRHKTIFEDAGIRSLMAVPLMRGGRLAAALVVGDTRPRIWNDRQLAFLQTVAERTWAAYEGRRLLERLRENEERFRLASRAIDGYIYDYDLRTGQIIRSEGFERLTGFTSEAMADHRRSWLERIHPEDRPGQVDEVILASAQARGGAFSSEFRFQRADGEWINLYDQGMVITDAAGRPARLVGITTDITRRKQMEETLRRSEASTRASEERARRLAEEARLNLQMLETVIDTMKEAVMLSDMQGSLTRANPAAVALHGFNSEAEMQRLMPRAEDLFEMSAPDGRPLPPEQWPLACAIRGETVINRELRVRRKVTGAAWTGLFSAYPVRDEHGAGLFILTTIIDITQMREAEQQRREMDALVKVQHLLVAQREQERLQIARDLHDGPIQDLIGLSFAIRSAAVLAPDGELAGMLKEMQEQALKLVSDLRGVCNELRPPLLSKFGLTKAIQALVEEQQGRAGAPQFSLALDDDRGALTDDARLTLYRICQESLNNIMRHAGAKNASVRLNIEPDRLLLDIQDDGQGFTPPNDWLSLAQRGHLGLVGIKERAEAAGGSVEITAAPGQGTRVLVRLPRGGAGG